MAGLALSIGTECCAIVLYMKWVCARAFFCLHDDVMVCVFMDWDLWLVVYGWAGVGLMGEDEQIRKRDTNE